MQCSIQLYEELHGPCYMYGYGSLTARAIYSGGIIIIDAQPMKLATATRTRRGAGTVRYSILRFHHSSVFPSSTIPHSLLWVISRQIKAGNVAVLAAILAYFLSYQYIIHCIHSIITKRVPSPLGPLYICPILFLFF